MGRCLHSAHGEAILTCAWRQCRQYARFSHFQSYAEHCALTALSTLCHEHEGPIRTIPGDHPIFKFPMELGHIWLKVTALAALSMFGFMIRWSLLLLCQRCRPTR